MYRYLEPSRLTIAMGMCPLNAITVQSNHCLGNGSETVNLIDASSGCFHPLEGEGGQSAFCLRNLRLML